jgi:hypothetical protein
MPGTELLGGVGPIGITQNNTTGINQPVVVCTRGYTTVLCANAHTNTYRGSTIIAQALGTFGKITMGTAAAADGVRVGFCAQTSSTTADGPCLIYYDGYHDASI